MSNSFLRQAIAIAIAEARRENCLTQPQLADFAELSRSYIAAVEAAKVGISCEALYTILGVLKIAPTAFFQRVEEIRARKPVLINAGHGKQRIVTYNDSTAT